MPETPTALTEVEFAGMVQGRALDVITAIMAECYDLARERAASLCTFAAKRRCSLEMQQETTTGYDLSGLTVNLSTTAPERDADDDD